MYFFVTYISKVLFYIHKKKPPNSNDVYTICYTSGTTAIPKGKKKKIFFLSYYSQKIDKFKS